MRCRAGRLRSKDRAVSFSDIHRDRERARWDQPEFQLDSKLVRPQGRLWLGMVSPEFNGYG